MQTVSCIIPAYNEGPRIRGVLSAVHRHPLISETIVVDDGSHDDTASVVRQFPDIRLVTHERNRGKSQAVVTGIRHAHGEFLFFLDADLLGVTPEAISALIEPVVSGQADISISLRKNAPWLWRIIGIDCISGERVLHRNLVARRLDEIGRLTSYALESYLNKLIVKNQCRIKIVPWNNVVSPWPQKKWGLLSGTLAFLRMLANIFKVMSLFEICYLTFKMRSLRVA